jgi:hypothetical protein
MSCASALQASKAAYKAEPYTAGRRIGAWWGRGFSNQPRAARAVTVSAEYKRLEA